MSFKNQRRCSKLEHHNGAPPITKGDEKLPMENGDIVLTNVVSRIFSPFLPLVSRWILGDWKGDI